MTRTRPRTTCSESQPCRRCTLAGRTTRWDQASWHAGRRTRTWGITTLLYIGLLTILLWAVAQ